jgi:hypothetical protein
MARRQFLCRPGGNKKFALLCHLILGRGYNVGELFDLLYADDPGGGPLAGREAIIVMLCHLGRTIAPLGLRIDREKRPGGKVYWVDGGRRA